MKDPVSYRFENVVDIDGNGFLDDVHYDLVDGNWRLSFTKVHGANYLSHLAYGETEKAAADPHCPKWEPDIRTIGCSFNEGEIDRLVIAGCFDDVSGTDVIDIDLRGKQAIKKVIYNTTEETYDPVTDMIVCEEPSTTETRDEVRKARVAKVERTGDAVTVNFPVSKY